jgi:hypothetical protein
MTDQTICQACTCPPPCHCAAPEAYRTVPPSCVCEGECACAPETTCLTA